MTPHELVMARDAAAREVTAAQHVLAAAKALHAAEQRLAGYRARVAEAAAGAAVEDAAAILARLPIDPDAARHWAELEQALKETP